MVAVAAGWEHCLALRADGSVVAWGDNSYGQSNVPASATECGRHCRRLLPQPGLAGGRHRHRVGHILFGGDECACEVLPTLRASSAGEDYSVVLVASGPPRFGHQPASVVAHLGSQTILNADCCRHLSAELSMVSRRGSGFRRYQSKLAADRYAGRRRRELRSRRHERSGSSDQSACESGGAAGSGNHGYRRLGRQPHGQCSIPGTVASPSAIAAGASHCLALNADGTVAAWGKNWDGQTNVPPTATNVVAIAAGDSPQSRVKR